MRKLRTFPWLGIVVAATLLALNYASFALAQSSSGPRVHRRTAPASGRSLVLEHAITPPVGAEGVFVIKEKSEEGIADRSGLFLMFFSDEDVEATRDESDWAIRARFTMLSPDPDTGDPRVRVEAVPIDGDTGTPLLQETWQAVYRLADEEAEWQEGSAVPEQYQDLMRPDWLAEWTLTPARQLPQHPIEPGYTWTAVADDDMADLSFGDFDGDAPLTGQFVQWVDVPGAAGPAAHLMETINIGVSEREEMTDGIMADVTFNLDVDSQFWLLSGDFPHQGLQKVRGTMLMDVNEDTGVPAEFAGTLTMVFTIERSIVRDTSGDPFPGQR